MKVFSNAYNNRDFHDLLWPGANTSLRPCRLYGNFWGLQYRI